MVHFWQFQQCLSKLLSRKRQIFAAKLYYEPEISYLPLRSRIGPFASVGLWPIIFPCCSTTKSPDSTKVSATSRTKSILARQSFGAYSLATSEGQYVLSKPLSAANLRWSSLIFSLIQLLLLPLILLVKSYCPANKNITATIKNRIATTTKVAHGNRFPEEWVV